MLYGQGMQFLVSSIGKSCPCLKSLTESAMSQHKHLCFFIRSIVASLLENFRRLNVQSRRCLCFGECHFLPSAREDTYKLYFELLPLCLLLLTYSSKSLSSQA